MYSVKHLDTNEVRPQERKSSIKTETKQKSLQIKQLSDIELRLCSKFKKKKSWEFEQIIRRHKKELNEISKFQQ